MGHSSHFSEWVFPEVRLSITVSVPSTATVKQSVIDMFSFATREEILEKTWQLAPVSNYKPELLKGDVTWKSIGLILLFLLWCFTGLSKITLLDTVEASASLLGLLFKVGFLSLNDIISLASQRSLCDSKHWSLFRQSSPASSNSLQQP